MQVIAYPGGSKPPPYDYIVGSPKRQKPFWGRRHYGMRAGWILLKIRHKQYGVNVDDVGLDVHIEPHNPISDAMAEKSPLRQCRFRLTGARPLCRCATSPRTAGSHPLQ